MALKEEWLISAKERTYLRELAKKQMEYAALTVMEKRKKGYKNLYEW